MNPFPIQLIAHRSHRLISQRIRHQYIPCSADSKIAVIANLIQNLQAHHHFHANQQRLSSSSSSPPLNTNDQEKEKEKSNNKDKEKNKIESKEEKLRFPGLLVCIRDESSPVKFAESLSQMDIKTCVLHEHAGINKQQRTEFLKKFRTGQFECAIVTASVARGLDFLWLDHVIIAQVPQTLVDFLHVCGRTGRLDSRGYVTSVVDEEDEQLLMKHCSQADIKLHLLNELERFGLQHCWEKRPEYLIEGSLANVFPMLEESKTKYLQHFSSINHNEHKKPQKKTSADLGLDRISLNKNDTL
ncbi:ATP-dependent RNA helicase, DEAD/DEAH box [Reticulomyxa filosa]|uniref:ATP-dependent RNA helicase, DEAD/DEAH box n=1 Tax=Reticulomyxa filosa TaxID=46433 RepID=X6NSC5_RETFI|nr:ATP-dependent RNA helicase, DEAD/DEAH box [Reticulomyxa filosa]|eukprot:ETO29195.1 ATP-dependent RNA helicase, DEAD/DEAH box [Reticulomyxa filosa]